MLVLGNRLSAAATVKGSWCLKPTSVCLIVAKSFDETSFNNEAAFNQKLANRRPRKLRATPQRDAHKERGARAVEARGR